MKTAIWLAVVALATPLWATREFYGNYPSFGLHADPHNVGWLAAKPHAHPYQVLLRAMPNMVEEDYCDGALISRDWIITAAHCIQKAKKIVAVLGAHKIIDREVSVQQVSIIETVYHPDWNKKGYENDLALLKLSDSFIYVKNSRFIRPIDLPKLSQKDSNFWGSAVTVTGWGAGNSTTGLSSVVLQRVESQIVTNRYCKVWYLAKINADTLMCVEGYSGPQKGLGDSGAPMVTDDNGMKILVGIAAQNGGWGTRSYPAIFTRITPYLEWIHSTTGITPRN